jgi:hypothetical protein
VDVKSVSKQIGDRQHQFKQRKALRNRRNDNSLVLSNGANGANLRVTVGQAHEIN